MQRPEIKYTTNAAGLHLAYWTMGAGPPDLVYVNNFVTHCDLMWEHESMASWLRQMATIGRLTAFDVSGTGASDPLAGTELPTMERWADDMQAVMDAVGIERATIIGQDAGGPVAAMFAATHPNRTERLVLASTFARQMAAPGYPQGYPPELRERGIQWWLDVWGSGNQLAVTAPALQHDESLRAFIGLTERSTSMGMRRPIFEMIQQIDIREILPSIRVPTLVLHRAGDRFARPALGRYLAEHIPNAKYVELPGDEHYIFLGDSTRVVDEIREFVTGVREPVSTDRVLSTLLFTDIVDSTAHAAKLGDRKWRAVLDQHDGVVRDFLRRFQGREVKMTGDGCLATFDGPARAIRCAVELTGALRTLDIRTRTGLHTGEVELRGDDIGGIAVHIGARVLAHAAPGEVWVSASVPPLVAGSGLRFADRGTYPLKGVPGEWQLFAVDGLAS